MNKLAFFALLLVTFDALGTLECKIEGVSLSSGSPSKSASTATYVLKMTGMDLSRPGTIDISAYTHPNHCACSRRGHVAFIESAVSANPGKKRILLNGNTLKGTLDLDLQELDQILRQKRGQRPIHGSFSSVPHPDGSGAIFLSEDRSLVCLPFDADDRPLSRQALELPSGTAGSASDRYGTGSP